MQIGFAANPEYYQYVWRWRQLLRPMETTGEHWVPTEGPTKRNRGAIEAIRRRPQSPNALIISGIPLAWSAYMNLTVKVVRLGTGIRDIQTPNRPFLQRPQGYQLRMGRSLAHASRDGHVAIPKVRVLIAFRR